jgi:hypothetical protein
MDVENTFMAFVLDLLFKYIQRLFGGLLVRSRHLISFKLEDSYRIGMETTNGRKERGNAPCTETIGSFSPTEH